RAINSISSIDVKKNEKGIIDYANFINVPFRVYSKNELNSLTGEYSSSPFVIKTVGVDCVCERACNYSVSIDNINACKIQFLQRKTVYKTVTVAVARVIKY
ncbi:MAG: cobalamin biosynthesis protein, partial [Treponema sp.]|nr:cobalamin biosynthesis protein [Treponema sp.]